MSHLQSSVRLTVSTEMDKRSDKEDENIRVPKRTRLNFNSDKDRFVITYKDKRKALNVRVAYKEDLTKLQDELERGVITEDQLLRTVFVTTNTLNYLVGRKRSDIEKYCYVTDGVENLMVGADPEFAIVDPTTSRYKYANQVLQHEGELGSDGPLAEVRPPPATEIDEFVNTIRGILKTKSSKIGNYSWLGGATFKSKSAPDDRVVQMGGHIHIGDPSLISDKQKTAIYTRIIQVLDELIALPLVRIDTPEPYLRRNTEYNGYGKYGRYGDQRPQTGRFEWRVPSGLWLVHPDLAGAVVGTTKAVSEACYQAMAEKNFDDGWVNAPPSRNGFLKSWGTLKTDVVRKIVNECDHKQVTPPIIGHAARKLRALGNYNKYKPYIEEFLRLVKMPEKDVSRINLDIKETWLGNGNLIKQP